MINVAFIQEIKYQVEEIGWTGVVIYINYKFYIQSQPSYMPVGQQEPLILWDEDLKMSFISYL